MRGSNDSVAVRERVAAFASSAQGSSLYLLRAIEQTVDALTGLTNFARAFSRLANDLAQEVSARIPTTCQFIDPDDEAINSLEKAYRSLDEYLPTMLLRKKAVDEDRALKPDHSELLHDAFNDCISSVAELIEALKAARDAVIAHDLKAESRDIQAHDSANGLIATLRT